MSAPPPVNPPPPSLSPQRILATVWLAVFSSSLFFRAVDPIIPQIAADLSQPVDTVALLATAFALPYALMQPVLGAMGDVLGKTRTMFACLVVVTISTFAGAFAWDLSVLMASRIISGIVAGGVFPISLAIVAQVVPIKGRQVAVSRLLAGAMLGNLLGSSAAGVIADLAGWRAVFIFNGCFALIAMVAAFVGFGGPGVKPTQKVNVREIPASYRTIFTNPLAKFCFGAVLMEGIFLFGIFPYVAQLLHEIGEQRAAIAGLVIAGFGVGGILYSLVIPWLLPRLGESRLMFTGGLLMGLGLIALAFLPTWPVQVALFALFGLAFYLLHGVIQIFVTELAPSARSSAAALHSTFFFLGQSIGPIYYRVAMTHVGTMPSMFFGAAMLIATGLVCSIWLWSPKRGSGRP
jgi:MFS transporter, DHA1 family, inner membrane transport protein